MIAPLVLVAAAYGLVIGSFLNVVVHRVPRNESVVRPRSTCPRCRSPIRWYDNVPVVSWLVLRARCRDCGEPISVRYPLVELAGALVFAGVVWRVLAAGWTPWALPAYLYLGALGLALTLIDLDVHRLPDALVLPAYPVLGALLLLASAATGDWSALVRAVVGGAGLALLYFAVAVAKPGGMGFGDVKLAGVLGAALAWIGWGELAVGAFGAFALGGAYAIGLLALRRAGRATKVPFGPWMVAGAAVGFAVGAELWAGYLGLMT